MDDTGLPISTSRVSTVPRIGALMVALASSSSARSTAAPACATWARASFTLARPDQRLCRRGTLPVLGLLVSGARLVERLLRHQLLLVERAGAVEGALRERHVGGLGFDLVLGHLRLGGRQRGAGGFEVGAGLAQAGAEVFLVELGQNLTRFHLMIDVSRQALDDAVGLRLDLDLGNRLDLARGHDRPHHRPALDRGEPGGIDVGGGPIGGGDAVGRGASHAQRDRAERPLA